MSYLSYFDRLWASRICPEDADDDEKDDDDIAYASPAPILIRPGSRTFTAHAFTSQTGLILSNLIQFV
jgi:hypothetical protein